MYFRCETFRDQIQKGRRDVEGDIVRDGTGKTAMRQRRAWKGVSRHHCYSEKKLSGKRPSMVKCADGNSYEITPDLVKIELVTVTEYGKPSVHASR